MTAETPLSRRRLLQSSAALGTLALAGCSGGGSSTTTNAPFDTDTRRENTPTETETETPVEYTTVDEAEPTAVMGEVVADEKLALVVMKKEQQTVSNEDLVLLELQIKNRTTGEYLSFQNMRMHLTDSEGTRHLRRVLGQDAGAEVYGEQLAPGELVWSRVLFQAPTDANGLKAVFTYDSPAISFDQVTIDLGESTETETTFEQSLDVVTYDVGKTVTDDGLSVTLDDVRVVKQIDGAGAAGENMAFVIPKVSIENATGNPRPSGLSVTRA